MEKHAKELAGLLSALANPNRLMILCQLMESPLSVGELGKKLDTISQPAISQHLHTLQNMGIISGEKKGQFVIYSLRDSRIRILFQTLKEQFCPDVAHKPHI